MYINCVYIFKYIVLRCTVMHSMNFISDRVNAPADLILRTIAVEFRLKLIRKDT